MSKSALVCGFILEEAVMCALNTGLEHTADYFYNMFLIKGLAPSSGND